MKPKTDNGPILVVSNRLPVNVHRRHGALEIERSVGGLVTALDPALRRLGGTWLGWLGIQLRPGETLGEVGEFNEPYGIEPVSLSDAEVRRYYHGFSNRTLWPLFHSLPERTQFERQDWLTYEMVNKRFAQRASELASGTSLVWIHDYQLLRAALHLRQLQPELRIAFFLHIPFPPYDLFRLLPWDREVLHGLLACDLIGFHCPGYVANFLDCAERLLGARVDHATGRVEEGNRTLRAAAFPLGIDYAGYSKLAAAAPSPKKPSERRVVLGVDRLDYTKGIPERIQAFERLLELHPEYRERVVLLQIAVPSRERVTEYRQLKRQIDELVGRVNGRFGTSIWSPIHYLYRKVSTDRLVGFYRGADVALVTPLRDGMNLVAKEYVACQSENPGVLVLSRMAGAAETMFEALRVNPYDIDGVAQSLHVALEMDLAERRDRMIALQRREKVSDIHRWLDDFLAVAQKPRTPMAPATEADFRAWLGRFLDGHQVALFLDYDGTLSRIAEHPVQATLRSATRKSLERCSDRGDTDVTIVSGRALEDVRKLVGIESLTYAGNHGLEIDGADFEHFVHDDVLHYKERARRLAAALEQIQIDGVWVEDKGASVTLHFRAADKADWAKVADQARAYIREAGFQARDAHCALEARPPIGWDKGHAVLHLLRTRYGQSWSRRVRVIYIGDDETDEDAFRAISGLGISFRVGNANVVTAASRLLPNVATVEALVAWLADR